MRYFLAISVFFLNTLNADIILIASPACKIETLTKGEIKQLFMLKKRYIEDERILVIDSSDEPTYVAFIGKYIDKSPKNMKAYWTRMLFTGRKIPPQKFSVEKLKNLTSKRSCFVTYIKAYEKPKLWRAIAVNNEKTSLILSKISAY